MSANHIFTYLNFIAILILIIVMGGNDYNADYNSYEQMYYMSKYFQIDDFDYNAVLWYGYSPDIAYNILNKIFLSINIDYADYKLITSALLLTVLFIFINRMPSVGFIVIPLYILYPFVIDVIQVRNFFVEVITIVVFYFYYKYKNKSWCICLIIFGSMFHSSLLILLPFIIFEKYYRGNIKLVFKILILVGVLVPIYAQQIISIRGSFFIPIDFMEHYNGYVNEEINYGYLLMYLYTIIPLAVLLFIKQKRVLFDNNENEYITSLIAFYKYICCLLPLAILVTHLSRIPRNMLLLYAVAISIYISKITWRKRIVVVLGSLLMFYVFGYLELYRTDIDYVAMILDNNNILYYILGQ